MILELAKKFSSMDLLEKLPETIRVIALLVLQRGLEPRPLGRASPESCPDGLAAVEVPAAAARHSRPETSLVVDRVVVVVLVQRVTAEFYLTEGLALFEEGHIFGVHTIYIDGRRLGELVTSEDHGIIAPIPDYSRDVRWCGVVSAGAELRIDGPKPPTILHPNETAYRDSGVV